MFTHRHKWHKIHNHKVKTSIIDMHDGQTGIIISITGGRMATKRLADLGLRPGMEIKVLRRTLFSGPIQIEACSSKLVLGMGLASKILVELK
jgi:ferrous iron transport protein A